MHSLKKSKTHFEQVPLEIVKKIAKEDIPGEERDGDETIVEGPKKTESYSGVPGLPE